MSQPTAELTLPTQPESYRLPNGRLLFKHDPQIIDDVLMLRAKGWTYSEIAKQLSCSNRIVALILQQHPEDVARGKERLANLAFQTAHRVVESYAQDLLDDKVSPNSKPIHAAILIDKARDLRGEAGVIVEHRSTGPDINQLRTVLGQAPIEVVVEDQSPPGPPGPPPPAPAQDQGQPAAAPPPPATSPGPPGPAPA